MQQVVSRLKGDKTLWFIVVALSLFSLLAVYSSTGTLAYKYKAGNTEYYLFKHFALIASGLILMFLAHLIDYRYYSRIAQLAVVVSVPLLILTLFAGDELNQAKRWLALPGTNLTFQTSDLAKLGLIMFIARVVAVQQNNLHSFREAFLPAFLPLLLICGLIAPADFSTAAMVFLTGMLLMFIGGINWKYLLSVAVAGIVVISVFFVVLFQIPNENLPGRMSTWKSRVEAFSESGTDVSFQNRQANIAIAKGGLLGKGPGNSSQRNFLPHAYSDFIFAIIIEEYGLLGGGFVVFLYLLFLLKCLRLAIRCQRPFGSMLVIGLSLSLVIQAFINMGVTVNLLPVTGLTLPLVSMGGTSLWFTAISIGIILSVSRSEEQEINSKAQTVQQHEIAATT